MAATAMAAWQRVLDRRVSQLLTIERGLCAGYKALMSKAQDPRTVPFDSVDTGTWRRKVEGDLEGASFDKKLRKQMPEGITLEPLYTAESGPAEPGHYPGVGSLVRGGTPLSTREGWQQAARYDMADPSVLVATMQRDKERGSTGAWLRFDRAARFGLEPTARASREYLGADGAAMHAAASLAVVVDLVAEASHPVIVDAGGSALPAAALFLGAAEERGFTLGDLRVDFAGDPLGQLAKDGALGTSLEDAIAQMTLLARYCEAQGAAGRVAVASGIPYHDAGGHAVDELAYGLGTALAYVRALEDAGFALPDAARRVGLRFAVGRHVFVEIAKLRAARVLWAKLLAAGGVHDVPPSIHAVASERTLTRRDPWVNMLRGTTQTFAAICGGASIVTTRAFDAALGQPEGLGWRMARNTQVVLGEESRLGEVIDPAGGSWYIESLTSDLARAAWEQIQGIERRGGVVACLRDGSAREAMRERWKDRSKGLDKRKVPITGVSDFAHLQEKLPSPGSGRDDALLDRLASEIGKQRDTKPGRTAALASLRKAASSDLVPAAVRSARAGATFSEIAGAAARGEGECFPAFESHRDAERFEAMRDAADRADTRPRVFLANLGRIPDHKARAMFAANLFAAGGVEAQGPNGTGDAEPAGAAERLADAFAGSGAAVACLCGTDAQYGAMGPAVASALRKRGARIVYLAGRPGEHEQVLADAGVSRFLFLGCDVHAELDWLLRELEVVR